MRTVMRCYGTIMVDKQRLRNIIGGCDVEDGLWMDNLAIVLCTYFSDHMDRPDPDPESDDSGWGEWVTEKTNQALTRITEAVLKEIERNEQPETT